MNAHPAKEQQLTIDALAAAAGTTTRNIRAFQTLGLLDHPTLRGRTGIYSGRHLRRLHSILGLQTAGFSLQSLSVLFAAYERHESLGDVLGLTGGEATMGGEKDEAELYGFAQLQSRARRSAPGRGGPLLSIVPTTVWDYTRAS
jgi:DNA-binding transcriptional MerR regulator